MSNRFYYRGVTRDDNGNLLASCTVSAYLAGTTTPATIYALPVGGSGVNFVTSDTYGSFGLYVDDSDYSVTQMFKLTVSKTGFGTLTYDNINIFVLTLANVKADADIASAIALKHTQGTDTTLGTMTSDISMNSHKIAGLSAPTTNGDAIRVTAKITEALLESATDLKHTQNTDTGTTSVTFDVGGGADVDLRVRAANGDANKPYLGYKAADSSWYFSNDGSAETKMVGATGAVYASAAEINAGIDATKTIAPDQLMASNKSPNVNNVKLVVNANVNKLDIFSRTGGVAPDVSNPVSVMIPDGNGNVVRSRAASYKSGTSQFIMADGANYWSKGSLDAEIKTAYVYAIWDAAGGIVWALGGYSGFTRVPDSTTATDDDFFLLEASSTYTKVITDYCVCVGKIRYQYDTADTPDHTIQATVLDAPQIVWNPKSDYGKKVTLATTIIQAAIIPEDSYVNVVVKQSGKYFISATIHSRCSDGSNNTYGWIKVGSSTYSSAIYISRCETYPVASAGYYATMSLTAMPTLNAGDTIHLGAAVDGNTNRYLSGDDTYIGATGFAFMKLD